MDLVMMTMLYITTITVPAVFVYRKRNTQCASLCDSRLPMGMPTGSSGPITTSDLPTSSAFVSNVPNAENVSRFGDSPSTHSKSCLP